MLAESGPSFVSLHLERAFFQLHEVVAPGNVKRSSRIQRSEDDWDEQYTSNLYSVASCATKFQEAAGDC